MFCLKKAFLMFLETTTLKKLFTFQEMELSYVSGETSKVPKTEIYYISSKEIMNEIFKKLF